MNYSFSKMFLKGDRKHILKLHYMEKGHYAVVYWKYYSPLVVVKMIAVTSRPKKTCLSCKLGRVYTNIWSFSYLGIYVGYNIP